MRPAAWACWCSVPPAKEASQRVEAVFRGELVEHKGNSAVFRVSEQWKGNLGVEVEVEWRDGSRGDCNGFRPKYLKVGNELLVFANGGRRRDLSNEYLPAYEVGRRGPDRTAGTRPRQSSTQH
jgi:hypothetical protein